MNVLKFKIIPARINAPGDGSIASGLIRVRLTDKVLRLKGVESKGEDGLCEGEPADLCASVSVPYGHHTGTEHHRQQVLTGILQIDLRSGGRTMD